MVLDVFGLVARGKAVVQRLRADRDITAGDAARDAGRWREAAGFYRAFLKRRPGRHLIWTQLGNCLKDSGDYEGARAAYAESLALHETADALLQSGHVMKLMGLSRAAERAYHRSLALQPRDNPALTEVLHSLDTTEHADWLPAALQTHKERQGRTIFFDVTDLVAYVRVNNSLSGIQRVVSNLVVQSGVLDPAWSATVLPVLPSYRAGVIYTVERAAVVALLKVVESRAPREHIDQAILDLLMSRQPIVAQAGDVFTIAGAFWNYQSFDLLNALRFAGVDVVIYIHDLIQITHPDYVEPIATDVFRRSFVDALYACSHVLTNSRFVAEEVRHFLATRMPFMIPVAAVTLATELDSRLAETTASIDDDVAAMATIEFVLVVSTIEVRKNHLYLIKIWERLIERSGARVPTLVFVGKWGWKVDELKEHLAGTTGLKDHLRIFNGIADTDLAFLYRHCLFTIYPSLAEGWGLPVGESLAYGKPCIASKSTAIPEVGGSFCRYIDPLDLDDGVTMIGDTLQDRAGLAAWTRSVERDFKPKSWAAFSKEFYASLVGPLRPQAAPPPRNNLVLAPATVAAFGDHAIAEAFQDEVPIVTGRMMRVRGWHGSEAEGCWASAPDAELVIATTLPEGETVTVFALLVGGNGAASIEGRLQVGTGTASVPQRLASGAQWVSAVGETGASGTILVHILSGRQEDRGDDTRYAGILSIAYVPSGDQQAHRWLAEAVLPATLPA